MDSIKATLNDGRASAGKRAKTDPANRIHCDLQRGLVWALAVSVRKFDKYRPFSVVWTEAMRNLEKRDAKEHRNALYFTDQLLKEFIKQLRQVSKDAPALARLFPLVVRDGRSSACLEEDLRHLACCSEGEHAGIDPGWNAIYEQILLGPVEHGQLQSITRSFDQLLQFRGLNLRGELTAFLQVEFPIQFGDIVNDWRNRQICIADLKLLLEKTSDKVAKLTQRLQSLHQV